MLQLPIALPQTTSLQRPETQAFTSEDASALAASSADRVFKAALEREVRSRSDGARKDVETALEPQERTGTDAESAHQGGPEGARERDA